MDSAAALVGTVFDPQAPTTTIANALDALAPTLADESCELALEHDALVHWPEPRDGVAWVRTPPLMHPRLYRAVAQALKLDDEAMRRFVAGDAQPDWEEAHRGRAVPEDDGLRGIVAWLRSTEGSMRVRPFLEGIDPARLVLERVPVEVPSFRLDRVGQRLPNAEALAIARLREGARRTIAFLALDPPAVLASGRLSMLQNALLWYFDVAVGRDPSPPREADDPFEVEPSPRANLSFLFGPADGPSPTHPIGVRYATDDTALVFFPFAHVWVRLSDGAVLSCYGAPGLLPVRSSPDGKTWLFAPAELGFPEAFDETEDEEDAADTPPPPSATLRVAEPTLVVRDLVAEAWLPTIPPGLDLTSNLLWYDDDRGQLMTSDLLRGHERAITSPLPKLHDDPQESDAYFLSTDYRFAWMLAHPEELGIFSIESGLPQLDLRAFVHPADDVDDDMSPYPCNDRAFVRLKDGSWRVFYIDQIYDDGRPHRRCHVANLRAMSFNREGDALLLATTDELRVLDVQSGQQRTVLQLSTLANALLADAVFETAVFETTEGLDGGQRFLLRQVFGTLDSLRRASAEDIVTASREASMSEWEIDPKLASAIVNAIR